MIRTVALLFLPVSNLLIRELPVELGQLSNLWQLDVEDLNITNVPQEVRKEGTRPVSFTSSPPQGGKGSDGRDRDRAQQYQVDRERFTRAL